MLTKFKGGRTVQIKYLSAYVNDPTIPKEKKTFTGLKEYYKEHKKAA